VLPCYREEDVEIVDPADKGDLLAAYYADPTKVIVWAHPSSALNACMLEKQLDASMRLCSRFKTAVPW
jgi:hypothetical protein